MMQRAIICPSQWIEMIQKALNQNIKQKHKIVIGEVSRIKNKKKTIINF